MSGNGNNNLPLIGVSENIGFGEWLHIPCPGIEIVIKSSPPPSVNVISRVDIPVKGFTVGITGGPVGQIVKTGFSLELLFPDIGEINALSFCIVLGSLPDRIPFCLGFRVPDR